MATVMRDKTGLEIHPDTAAAAAFIADRLHPWVAGQLCKRARFGSHNNKTKDKRDRLPIAHPL